jgi:hypothetical protein
MITIKPKKTSGKKVTTHYILQYNYMIGDDNGYTDESVKLSKDNPFIERYVTLINKLKPTKGHWGVVLDKSRLIKHYTENQITKDEYEFLNGLMFESNDSNEYTNEFFEGVRSDAEYSFLVFQGCDLYYIDEYGEKHETEFT